MNIKEVKDLIHEILQSDISEFELEHTGTRVRLRRGFHGEAAAPPPDLMIPANTVPPAAARIETAALPSAQSKIAEQGDLHFITSPIVGTFYRAPSPGAEAYVKVGDMVEEGSILCIVEAMKLMNEIPSDIAGEVVCIEVENAHPVEFGQRLVGIRPRI